MTQVNSKCSLCGGRKARGDMTQENRNCRSAEGAKQVNIRQKTIESVVSVEVVKLGNI